MQLKCHMGEVLPAEQLEVIQRVVKRLVHVPYGDMRKDLGNKPNSFEFCNLR